MRLLFSAIKVVSMSTLFKCLHFQAKKMRLFSFWVEQQDEQSSGCQRRAWAR